MSDLCAETHRAALGLVRGLPQLEDLLARGEQRRLAREARDWYLATHAGSATRGGTCVVATAGPPGAGKSTVVAAAVPDAASRLVIDPDIAKDYLAQWCIDHGRYADTLTEVLPDGELVAPRDGPTPARSPHRSAPVRQRWSP